MGFKMLKSMGWEGKGLGAGERGIQEPVRPAEMRDKINKFQVCWSFSFHDITTPCSRDAGPHNAYGEWPFVADQF